MKKSNKLFVLFQIFEAILIISTILVIFSCVTCLFTGWKPIVIFVLIRYFAKYLAHWALVKSEIERRKFMNAINVGLDSLNNDLKTTL